MHVYERTLPQDPVTNQKVKRYYGKEIYDDAEVIFVQQNFYALKSYCQDLTRHFQFCKTGANNLAEDFNHTVAFDSPESMGEDRFLSSGKPLHSAFTMYHLCEVIIGQRVR
jgi:hypothetical protein